MIPLKLFKKPTLTNLSHLRLSRQNQSGRTGGDVGQAAQNLGRVQAYRNSLYLTFI